VLTPNGIVHSVDETVAIEIARQNNAAAGPPDGGGTTSLPDARATISGEYCPENAEERLEF